MKYIAFWEFGPGDLDKIVQKYEETTAEREEAPGKYPKIIFQPHSYLGEFKGFTLMEADDPEQLVNLQIQYMPGMKYSFVPIFDAIELIELYKKTKK